MNLEVENAKTTGWQYDMFPNIAANDVITTPFASHSFDLTVVVKPRQQICLSSNSRPGRRIPRIKDSSAEIGDLAAIVTEETHSESEHAQIQTRLTRVGLVVGAGTTVDVEFADGTFIALEPTLCTIFSKLEIDVSRAWIDLCKKQNEFNRTGFKCTWSGYFDNPKAVAWYLMDKGLQVANSVEAPVEAEQI